MPRISVIIPTYNYGLYIQKAIDSVLCQQNVDAEVIVIDDGSTDNSPAILRSYGERIRVFTQENKGAPAARNLGLLHAKGEYVLFLDADDWLLPDALSARDDYLRKHTECGWVYGPVRYVTEEGKDLPENYSVSPFAYRKKRQGNILPYLLLGELIHLPAVMVQRELVKRVGGFDVRLGSLQDYELWLRLANEAQVGFINLCHVMMRVHEGSISRSVSDGFRMRYKILTEAEYRYPNTVKKLGRAWQAYYATVLGERGRYLFQNGEKKEGVRMISKAIQRDPLAWRHYAALVKFFFKHIRG